MLQEHHLNQRNPRLGIQQMGPPNQRAPIMMSTGVLVTTMPTGPIPALITTTPISSQQQPKTQIYHFETIPGQNLQNLTTNNDSTELQQQQQQQHSPNLNNSSSSSSEQLIMNNISNNNGTNTGSAPNNPPLANIKEKTPMCLVNELARYNKIQHQYRLTGEQGPAHKKIFTVTLKLGKEEYEAEGPSIKKAQHSAAAKALTTTEFKHPPPKSILNRPGTGGHHRQQQQQHHQNNGILTPTVELNALAMKRGERAVYVLEGGAPIHHQGFMNQPPLHQSGGGGGFYPTRNFNYTTTTTTQSQQPRYNNNNNNNGYNNNTINNNDARRSSNNNNNNIRNNHHYGYENRYFNHQYRPQHGGIGGGGGGGGGSHHNPHPHHPHLHLNHHQNSSTTTTTTTTDPYSVRLRVGDREYPGTDGVYGHGPTVQSARHDAAAKAVDHIKQLNGGVDDETSSAAAENTNNTEIVQESAAAAALNNVSYHHQIDANSELKSPISLVYEIALKRNLQVVFEVLSEKGPPHMKVFITQCRVGSFEADGEGNGKKISKKRAAEKMIEELGKLPPILVNNVQPSMSQLKRKRLTNKKKTRNLIKVNTGDKTVSENAEEINPISRLIQIQQANKEREPIYTVLEERGAARRREFVIEAAVGEHCCVGVGPNKKVAKRNAADALLKDLGYSINTTTQNNSSLQPQQQQQQQEQEKVTSKEEPSSKATTQQQQQQQGEKCRKVTFVEETTNTEKSSSQTQQNVGGSGGRQLVPGVLLVTEQNSGFLKSKTTTTTTTAESSVVVIEANKPSKPVSKVAPLKNPPSGVRSKDQLMYLAQLMNIQVHFSDFPKANHEMYLTLVSLGTNPPQVCHGEGSTTDASHETAALEALKVLSELGLDIATNNKDTPNE